MTGRKALAPALLLAVLTFIPDPALGRTVTRVRPSTSQETPRSNPKTSWLRVPKTWMSKLKIPRLGNPRLGAQRPKPAPKLGSSLHRFDLGRQLTTTRSALNPITPFNASSAGKHARVADLRKRGPNRLRPVAMRFTTWGSRLKYTTGLLGRDLSARQQAALMEVYNSGKGERGTDGRGIQISARVKGYRAVAQLRKKVRILRKAGFNMQETRMLMERGVMGSGNAIFGASRRSLDTVNARSTDNDTGGSLLTGVLWLSGVFGDL